MNKARIFFILFILTAWEIMGQSGLIHAGILPPFSDVVKRFGEMLFYEKLIQTTLYSIFMVLLAMGLSVIITVVLIILGRKYKWVGTNIELLHSIVSPLPGIAILPLVILWFGINVEAMLFILVHATLWPMWRQLALAVDRLHKQYNRLETVFHLSKFKRFFHIYVQGSLLDLKSALSVSWSRGWRALISVEMIFGMVGNQTGLGWLIYERRMYMDTEGLYAGLIAIGLCGVFFEALVFTKLKLGRVS
ncbi:ABC transporter permease [Fusibacter tunisiensis]|uniref:NitT/TauT family transport system permease protein n=1 Tax=Fusibacter tunisiensis TaxID=1008308 RepID=A0ABS2MRU4_9FIRM|nr:ABC transporter permease subunit [Fusibacter tunisiensis]MBM7562111.1 NitT/TauT family transport system permease protein [Fusibacter tunisiensis]